MTYKRGDTILCGASALAHKLASEPDGFVSGIASSPTVDAMGHVVQAGAFDRSIRTKGLRGPGGIKLLAGHDPEKIAGIITRLETVGGNLQIDALLNLNISYARDLYEAAKQIGGLSFSVGFRLEEFEIVEAKNSKRGETLIVKSGDLLEVSIVTLPGLRPSDHDARQERAAAGKPRELPAFNACMAQITRMKELLTWQVTVRTHFARLWFSRRHKLMSISEYSGIGVQALDSFSRNEVQLAPAVLRRLQRLCSVRPRTYDARKDAIMLTGGPALRRKEAATWHVLNGRGVRCFGLRVIELVLWEGGWLQPCSKYFPDDARCRRCAAAALAECRSSSPAQFHGQPMSPLAGDCAMLAFAGCGGRQQAPGTWVCGLRFRPAWLRPGAIVLAAPGSGCTERRSPARYLLRPPNRPLRNDTKNHDVSGKRKHSQTTQRSGCNEAGQHQQGLEHHTARSQQCDEQPAAVPFEPIRPRDLVPPGFRRMVDDGLVRDEYGLTSCATIRRHRWIAAGHGCASVTLTSSRRLSIRSRPSRSEAMSR